MPAFRFYVVNTVADLPAFPLVSSSPILQEKERDQSRLSWIHQVPILQLTDAEFNIDEGQSVAVKMILNACCRGKGNEVGHYYFHHFGMFSLSMSP